MRITCQSDCVSAVVSGRVSPELLDTIDRVLTFSEPGAFFTPQYKRGVWDGKRRLYKAKTQTFPVGLLDRVLEKLRANDVEVEVIDERPIIPEVEAVTTLKGHRADRGESPLISLHEDQVAALQAFLEVGRGCLQLPTGSGKTEIAAALLATFPRARALVICDRKTLLRQTAERLEGRLGERVGLIGDGRQEITQRVTVATIQSLWHHYERYRQGFFKRVEIVIVDEAHSISPKSWFQTLEVIPASIRLGLSATIKEATRRMIVEAYLGPIIHEQAMTDLIELGRLAFPNVAMLRMGGLVGEEAGPQQAYVEGVVENRRRNEAVVDAALLAQTQKKPALILVVRIEHGHRLRRLFEAKGLDVPFVWGDSHPDTITRSFRDLEGGRIPALIMSTIGDKGLDLPAIRALIIASGQRSALLTIQRIGRAVRKKQGENTVDVLDFSDMSCRMLRSQADDRRRTYARKGLNPRVIETLETWLV
jgi:superfamily II DNA or RNA helicase